MITCELDVTSTPFWGTTIITYEIELLTSGKKLGFNILDDEYFTIPYKTDTIPNSPYRNRFPTQAKQSVCVIDTNREEPITDQGELDKINCYQNPHGKSKVKISLRRSKIQQRTDLEDIHYRFYKVRPVVSYIEVHIRKKPPTQNTIGEGLKGYQKKVCE